MKFFAVFAAVLAVAFATPTGWTLNDLDSALSNPTTNPELIPILEQALNVYMQNLFAGEEMPPTGIRTHAGVFATLTLSELDAAISNTDINPVFKPYLEQALNELMSALFAGEAVEAVNVQIPSLDISYWNLQDIDAALDNPKTPEQLQPIFIDALNKLMAAMHQGHPGVNAVVIAIPAELVPVVSPAPGAALLPAIVPSDVITSSNPLVQIILNVQGNENLVDVSGLPTTPVEESPVGPQPTPVLPGIAVQPIRP